MLTVITRFRRARLEAAVTRRRRRLPARCCAALDGRRRTNLARGDAQRARRDAAPRERRRRWRAGLRRACSKACSDYLETGELEPADRRPAARGRSPTSMASGRARRWTASSASAPSALVVSRDGGSPIDLPPACARSRPGPSATSLVVGGTHPQGARAHPHQRAGTRVRAASPAFGERSPAQKADDMHPPAGR